MFYDCAHQAFKHRATVCNKNIPRRERSFVQFGAILAF